ncbi:hypothetical protein [Blastococcus sp. CT_GayMR16]|uniref:hypothetical protein n=1 Tax=Blastococcus sp. CT_GayMR16 TaxID=2559607 RepID=UPI0010743793|nr:hypothetical protein [Blastococcus sp. CT_GayMR16]TFV87400.1 hypothetical protein E4P38_13955 [Blastococcus sp. CT_GayMR16]
MNSVFYTKAAHAQITQLTVYEAWTSATWDNHEYMPLLGIGWEEAARELSAEQDRINSAKGNFAKAEATRIEKEEEAEWEPESFGFLDLGVKGLVLALSAGGCCPITSCNGLPGHLAGRPLVAFIADLQRLHILDGLVSQARGCRLGFGDGRVVVSADTHEPLLELARSMTAGHEYFSASSEPRRPRSLDDSGFATDEERNTALLYPSWDRR